LNFTHRKEGGSFLSRPKTTHAKLEVTISPQETTDGLKLIVEGQESILT
jgi:hypothetical protein